MLLLCLPLAAQAQDDDRGVLTRFLERQLSGAGNEVTITGFNGALSSRATIDRLEIADPDGVWMVLDNLVFSWTRSALLTESKLLVQELTAERINLIRRPAPDPERPSAEATPFSFPSLPISISIDKLAVAELRVGPDWLGQPVEAALAGALAWTDSRIFADIEGARTDGQTGSLTLKAEHLRGDDSLSVNFNLTEAPNGVLTTALDVPDRPAMTLSLSGSGPLNDFGADFALRTDAEDRLTGRISLNGPAETRKLSLQLDGDVRPLMAPDYRDFFGAASLIQTDLSRQNGGFALDNLTLRSRALELTGMARLDATYWPIAFDLQGTLAPQGDDPTLLPFPGARTYARAGRLSASYNSAISDEWSARTVLSGLERPEFSAADVSLKLSGTIAPDNQDERWSARGTYEASGLAMTDPALALAIGPEIRGGFSLTSDRETPVMLDNFTLIGPGLNLSAVGEVARSDGLYQLDATGFAIATDLGRFALLSGLDLSGSGQANVKLNYSPFDGSSHLEIDGTSLDLGIGQPRVDAVLAGEGTLRVEVARDITGTRLKQLSLRTDQASVRGEGEITNSRTRLDFNALLPDASVLSPQLTGAMRVAAQARRADGGDTRAKITAIGPQLSAQIDGVIPQDGETGEIRGRVELDDLTPYSDLAGRALTGSARADFSGTGDLRGGDFSVQLTANGQDLGIGIKPVDALLAGAARLEGALQREGDHTELRDFAFRTPAMRAGGNAQQDAGLFTADITAAIFDARVIDPNLSGAITFAAIAQNDGSEQTHFDITAQAPGADLALRADLNTELEGPFLTQADLADLALYRDLIGQPVAGHLHLSGRGALEPGGALHLDLDGRGQDLVINPQVPALSTLLKGTTNLTLNARRAANGAIDLRNLLVENPRLEARAEGALGADLLHGSVATRITDLSDLVPGMTGMAEARLTAVPDGTGTRVDLRATAPGAQVTGEAQVASRARAYQTQFSLDADLADLRLLESFTSRRLRGAGQLHAQGEAFPRRGRFELDLTGRSQNLALGQPAIDGLLTGTGQINARVTRNESGAIRIERAGLTLPNLIATATGRRSPEGLYEADFEARAPQLSVIDRRLQGPLRLAGSARIQDGISRIDATATGLGNANARAQGRYGPGGFDMAITGQLPLALANKEIAPQALSGTAQLDLRLRGHPSLDALSGKISTQNARLAIPQRRTALSDLSGTLRLERGQLGIDLSAREPRGGRLMLSGQVSPAPGLPADLTLRGEGVDIRQPGLFDTKADALLALRGPLAGGAKITGLVSLDRTEIQIPDGVGGIGDLMEIRHVAPDTGVAQTLRRAGLSIAGVDLRRGGDQTTGSGARAAVAHDLDLRIAAPARIFIRGRGLDAELGGSFSLRGTTRDVIPAGRLELIRGRITILQQRFSLDEGYGMLEGDFTPYINLSASTERGDYTMFITMEGDVSQPDIRFSSAPDLPEDEVLARLIFGRDLRNISPLQAVQLASAISTLAGGPAGDFMNDIREKIGLDDLDITADDTGTAQLRAGKYLNDDLYVDTTVDTEGKATVNMNLDLNPDWTLKGSTDSTGRSSVGVFFEKDY